jgi:hypothetical protein
MKKRWYFLLAGFLIFIISLATFFFLSINQRYIDHATLIYKLDSGYPIIQASMSYKALLKQKLELLPHLRRNHCRYYNNLNLNLPILERKLLLQQTTSDLPTLLYQANETQARLSSFLKEFSTAHPSSRFYIPPVKGIRTINSLLQTRWNGDGSMITDYSRATISFPTVSMMYEGLEDLKKSGLIILKITDNFKIPCLGGYRDITVIFRDFTNGHIGELQFNTHSIMEFKNGLGTDLFHVIRTLLAIPATENRPLSEREKICLDSLFELERQGYDAALAKASENQ